jgi:hypothetical protein
VSDTEGQSESQASAVPEKATQGAEIQGRNWSWVEATVWNERMLAALGNGVKGGKWPSEVAQCFLRYPRAVHHGYGPCVGEPIPMRKLPTGEPCAGEPHARFGGRGRRKPFPTPIEPPETYVVMYSMPVVSGVPSRVLSQRPLHAVRLPRAPQSASPNLQSGWGVGGEA